MSVSVQARTAFSAQRIFARPAALPLAVLAVLLLCIPLFVARPAPLSSDESLYLAEAYSIARGEGLTYPSGEPITHRAPLFPAILAPAVDLAGPDAAYTVTKALVAANVLLLLLIGWRLGGALAGAVAGVTAAGSAYLNGLGTTLYLDPAQCTFLLLALLALHEASRDARAKWFAAAGVSAAAALLVKESALQWAPLAVVAWLALPSLRTRAGVRGALVFTLAFAASVAPWWAWVYAQSGHLFLMGEATAPKAALLAAAGLLLAGFAGLAVAPPRAPERPRPRAAALAGAAALALIAAWGAFMLYALTRYSSWDYPDDYWTSVPHYLRTVAPQAQPYFLLAAAWGWAAFAALRGDERARLIAVAALLFLPFALFAANRGLQLRDALPLVYLSYLLLGIATADVVARVRRAGAEPLVEGALIGALVIGGGVFVAQQTASFRNANAAVAAGEVRPDSWDNPFAREIAAWMVDALPADARVLTSRLYFSSLHVRTGARFEIHQMPTVRVDVDADGERLLAARSNLFRWGDPDTRPAQPGDTWLYLRQFPGKRYWVALSQQELLDYIATQRIDYLVLTGEDAAFSSIAYAAYFSGHPAFRLLEWKQRSPADQMFAFAIDRTKLTLRSHSTVIGPESFDALSRETGLDRDGIAQRLGTPLRVTDAEHGLSAREQWAALGGLDLGLR